MGADKPESSVKQSPERGGLSENHASSERFSQEAFGGEGRGLDRSGPSGADTSKEGAKLPGDRLSASLDTATKNLPGLTLQDGSGNEIKNAADIKAADQHQQEKLAGKPEERAEASKQNKPGVMPQAERGIGAQTAVKPNEAAAANPEKQGVTAPQETARKPENPEKPGTRPDAPQEPAKPEKPETPEKPPEEKPADKPPEKPPEKKPEKQTRRRPRAKKKGKKRRKGGKRGGKGGKRGGKKGGKGKGGARKGKGAGKGKRKAKKPAAKKPAKGKKTGAEGEEEEEEEATGQQQNAEGNTAGG